MRTYNAARFFSDVRRGGLDKSPVQAVAVSAPSLGSTQRDDVSPEDARDELFALHRSHFNLAKLMAKASAAKGVENCLVVAEPV
jgi:hypothetical protein